MFGLNGDGKRLAAMVAAALQDVAGHAGRTERAERGYFVRLLWRDDVRQLMLGRKDRRPSTDEALVAREAAGVPDASEPLAGRIWVSSQDGTSVRVDTVEFHWSTADIGVIGGGRSHGVPAAQDR